MKNAGTPLLVRDPLVDGLRGGHLIEQSLWVAFDVDVPVASWIAQNRAYFETLSEDVKWEEFKENPDS